MSSATTVLDSVEVRCQDKHWCLTSTSQVQFDHTTKQFSPDIDCNELLQMLRVGKAWVSHSSFNMRFEVDLPGCLFSDSCRQEIVQSFASAMRGALWWEKFPISISLVIGDSTVPGNVFWIKITTKRDLQIPYQIPTLTLKCINMHLLFSQISKSSVSEANNIASDCSNLKDEFDDILSQEILEAEPYTHDSRLVKKSSDDEVLDGISTFPDQSHLLYNTTTTLLTPQSSLTTGSVSQAIAFSVNGHITSLMQSMNRMAEEAVCVTIGGRQLRRTTGIRLSKCCRVDANLSSILPAIFQPEFYMKVMQHQRFVPIIVHSLTNSAILHAQSPNLTRKIQGLLSNSTLDTGYPISNISDNLQACIWAMMRRSIHDSKSARRLNQRVMEDATASTKLADYESDLNFADDIYGSQDVNAYDMTIATESSIYPDFDPRANAWENDESGNLFFDQQTNNEEGFEDMFGSEESYDGGIDGDLHEMLLENVIHMDSDQEDDDDELLLQEPNNWGCNRYWSEFDVESSPSGHVIAEEPIVEDISDKRKDDIMLLP